MRHVTLCDAEALAQEGGHQVAVAVVAHHKIGLAAQLRKHLALHVKGKALKVWPDFKPGDPLAQHRAVLLAERHAQDERRVAARHRLPALVARRAARLRDEPRHDDDADVAGLTAGRLHAPLHLLLQRTHRVQQVHHLAARVRQTEHVRLAEKTVRAEYNDVGHVWDACQEALQHVGIGRLHDVLQHADHLPDAAHVATPPTPKPQLRHLRRDIRQRRRVVKLAEHALRARQRRLELAAVANALADDHVVLAFGTLGRAVVQRREPRDELVLAGKP
mmetsp:Transcript_5764/g.17595  ORF Transcript_5764/g.17595 Transcript_5764/m.17595 type:complete len:276 (+) Transcript_5764:1585-2412(+)